MRKKQKLWRGKEGGKEGDGQPCGGIRVPGSKSVFKKKTKKKQPHYVTWTRRSHASQYVRITLSLRYSITVMMKHYCVKKSHNTGYITQTYWHKWGGCWCYDCTKGLKAYKVYRRVLSKQEWGRETGHDDPAGSVLFCVVFLVCVCVCALGWWSFLPSFHRTAVCVLYEEERCREPTMRSE